MRQIQIGGAASSPELIQRMEERFKCRVYAGYGLTETAPVLTFARPKRGIIYQGERERYERQAMTGWPVPGVEIRVVDPQGIDVARDGKEYRWNAGMFKVAKPLHQYRHFALGTS